MAFVMPWQWRLHSQLQYGRRPIPPKPTTAMVRRDLLQFRYCVQLSCEMQGPARRRALASRRISTRSSRNTTTTFVMMCFNANSPDCTEYTDTARMPFCRFCRSPPVILAGTGKTKRQREDDDASGHCRSGPQESPLCASQSLLGCLECSIEDRYPALTTMPCARGHAFNVFRVERLIGCSISAKRIKVCP